MHTKACFEYTSSILTFYENDSARMCHTMNERVILITNDGKLSKYQNRSIRYEQIAKIRIPAELNISVTLNLFHGGDSRMAV